MNASDLSERKNWWVTALDGDGETVEEWLIKDCTDERSAVGEAAVAIDNMRIVELDGGRYIEAFSVREALVVIRVKSGTVQDVSGLPDGWLCQVIHHPGE